MPNAGIEDYRKRVDGMSTGSQATDDYYQMAREQEYSLLFDKEVALERAKQNAMKYTNGQLAAQGLSSTGYGSSMQAGIHNTYLNRINEAQSAFGQNMQDINQQQQQAAELAAAQRAGNVTNMIQSAQNEQQLNDLMKSYGYGDVDASGNFVLQRPAGMSDDDWNQIQYYYGFQKSNIGSNLGSRPTYDSLQSLGNTIAGAYDNAPLGQVFEYEFNHLASLLEKGKLDANTAIKMQGSHTEDEHAEPAYIFFDGKKFTRITEEEYNEYKNKDGYNHIWLYDHGTKED